MLRPEEKLGYWLLQVVTDLSKNFGSIMMLWVPYRKIQFCQLGSHNGHKTYSAGPYG